MSRTTPSFRSGLVLAGALALASCGPADTTQWKTLAPEGAGFSVVMPGEPRVDRHVASGAKTSFDSTVYTLVLAEGFFSVTESRFPETTDMNEAESLLEQGCDDIVESASATVTSRQTIYLNGTAGRRVEANVPESVVPDGGGALYGRVYLANRRRYELAAVLPRGASTAQADRFFDSFQIETP